MIFGNMTQMDGQELMTFSLNPKSLSTPTPPPASSPSGGIYDLQIMIYE
jgi:hypothetical protein